jgi:hypothetical protein
MHPSPISEYLVNPSKADMPAAQNKAWQAVLVLAQVAHQHAQYMFPSLSWTQNLTSLFPHDPQMARNNHPCDHKPSHPVFTYTPFTPYTWLHPAPIDQTSDPSELVSRPAITKTPLGRRHWSDRLPRSKYQLCSQTSTCSVL